MNKMVLSGFFLLVSEAGGCLQAFAAQPLPTEEAAAIAASSGIVEDMKTSEETKARHALLIQAIREKRVLIFNYNGFARTVEPHAYGQSGKGETILHGFQTDGGSASSPPPGWRTYAVAEIQDLKLGAAHFGAARDGYSADEPRLDPLWARLPGLSTQE